MNLHSDARYTIAPEYSSSGKPRHVVRFCGDFLRDFSTKAAALAFAVGEKARRNGALTVTEIPASK